MGGAWVTSVGASDGRGRAPASAELWGSGPGGLRGAGPGAAARGRLPPVSVSRRLRSGRQRARMWASRFWSHEEMAPKIAAGRGTAPRPRAPGLGTVASPVRSHLQGQEGAVEDEPRRHRAAADGQRPRSVRAVGGSARGAGLQGSGLLTVAVPPCPTPRRPRWPPCPTAPRTCACEPARRVLPAGCRGTVALTGAACCKHDVTEQKPAGSSHVSGRTRLAGL